MSWGCGDPCRQPVSLGPSRPWRGFQKGSLRGCSPCRCLEGSRPLASPPRDVCVSSDKTYWGSHRRDRSDIGTLTVGELHGRGAHLPSLRHVIPALVPFPVPALYPCGRGRAVCAPPCTMCGPSSLPDTPRLGCGPGLGPRSLMVTYPVMAGGPGRGAVSMRPWWPLEGTLVPVCF